MTVQKYQAAGAVVVYNNLVLVLERPERREIRLPKGHIEPDEEPVEAAKRETAEESGFVNLKPIAPLGTQLVKYTYRNVPYERLERFFLMERVGGLQPDNPPEAQFRPRWVEWEKAEDLLTFEAEREWLRRARQMWEHLKS